MTATRVRRPAERASAYGLAPWFATGAGWTGPALSGAQPPSAAPVSLSRGSRRRTAHAREPARSRSPPRAAPAHGRGKDPGCCAGAAVLRARGSSWQSVLAHGPDREVHRPADRFQRFTGGVPPPDFLVQRDPPLPAADPGRPLGSGARKGFGPPPRLRVGGRAGTGRQAPQPRMRPGQPSLDRLAQVDQHMSGSRAPLPKPSPLRTGRDDCSSSGSSLGRPVPDPRVVPMMAPPVYQLQVVHLVRSAAVARCVVVFVDERNVLIRVEPHTTHRASVVLPSQQRQALWRAQRSQPDADISSSPSSPGRRGSAGSAFPGPCLPRDGHVVVSCEPCPAVHEVPRAVEVSATGSTSPTLWGVDASPTATASRGRGGPPRGMRVLTHRADSRSPSPG